MTGSATTSQNKLGALRNPWYRPRGYAAFIANFEGPLHDIVLVDAENVVALALGPFRLPDLNGGCD